MDNVEKKIVTGVMWAVSALVGFIVAEKVYDKGMLGYIKVFHKDLYEDAIKQISQ